MWYFCDLDAIGSEEMGSKYRKNKYPILHYQLQWCVIEMLHKYISTNEMKSLWMKIECIKSAVRLLNIDCVNKEGLDLSKKRYCGLL